MDPKSTYILLLDDDPNLRRILGEILKVKGYESFPVKTGKAALARVEHQDFSVALIDIKLEDMSGLDVLRGIKARSPETECIMLTGIASQATAIEAINLGAYSYFQKPYEVDQLLIAIQRAAEKHIAGHALQVSEARFRSLIENSLDLICILNPDATLRYASSSIERLLGYTKEDIIIGTDLRDYIHPEDISTFVEAFRLRLHDSDYSSVPLRLRILHKNGTWRTLEGTGNNLLDNSAVEGIVINARDITEREHTEEALKASQLSYQKLVEQIPSAIYRDALDDKATTLFISPRIEELTGYAPEEWIADPGLWSRILHSDDRNRVLAENQLHLATGAPFISDYRFLAQDGRVVWVRDEAVTIRDPSGQPMYDQGIITDITDRKQAEESLRTSESSLQSVLQSTADGILAVGIENEVLYANQRFAEIWRIPPEVMASREDPVLLNYVLEQLSDPKKFLKKVQDLYKSKKESFDTIYFKDGRVFERLSRPLMRGTKVRGRVWSFRDVTSRKQAEEALSDSEGRYRQLVERTPNGILIHVDGQIVFANSAGAKILGAAKSEDLIGKGLFEFIHPDYQKIVKGRVKQINREKKPVPLIQEKLVRLDGTVIDAEVTAIPFTFENKNAVQVVFSDITVRRRAEERLTKLNECFLRFGSDPIANINLLVEFTGEMFAATCALYNQLQGKFLCSIGSWNTPPDYQSTDKAEGHICNDVIKSNKDEIVVIRGLQDSHYARTDSNVSKFQLQTYVGMPVRIGKSNAGVLCVVFQNDIIPAEDDKRMLGIIASALGVEEDRRRSSEVLRESEERYRMLAENMSDTVWLMDMSLHTTYISPSVTRLRGYTLDEINSIPLERQMTPDSLKCILQVFADILSPETIAQRDKSISRVIELEMYKKDGMKFWTEITFTLIRDSQGTPLAILGSGRDISERKKAETALQESEKYFRFLIENNTDAVILVDPRGLILYESPAYARMMGWAADKRLGKSGFEHIHPDDKSTIAELLSDLMQHPGEFSRVTFRNQHKDGSWHWIEATCTNMLGESSVHGLIFNMHDITERKWAEEEIHRRVADLEVLYENGLSISVLLEPRKIAQKMIEILRQKLNWHHATIRLYHPETNRVEILALNKPGLTPEQTQAEIVRLNKIFASPKKGLFGWVISHGETVRSGDVQADERYITTYPDIRSGLYVPLKMGERSIGVISVESRQENRFSLEDERLLQTLAAQSAIAFENARLFEEIRRRLAELESLSQVSISLTSAIDLQSLLEKILMGARNAIPAAEKGSILLIEQDGLLHLQALSGYTDSRLMGMPLSDQNGYAVRVARERTPIKIDDARAEYEVPYKGMIEEIDSVLCGIAAPLIVKGKVIGVISLDNASQKAAFTESDLHLLVTFASSAAVAIENARLFIETQQRLHRLTALHSIDAAIGASVDTHVTLSIVLEHVMVELKADAAAVLLLNPITRMLEYAAGRGFRVHSIEGIHQRLGEGLAGQSALQRRAINISNLQNADEVGKASENSGSWSASLQHQILEEEKFVGYHAIPLIAKGQVQGVLEIFQRTPMQVDQEWITFFEMLAGQTAIAVDNGRLFENLQKSNLELTLAYDATIQGWSQALELRDEDTEGHTRRVTDLTMRLIQTLGVEEAESEHARRGSLLHDIGKIAVPDAILLKSGPLNEQEWNVMSQHPQYAYNLLNPITYLRPAIHIPYCHHEKWDGTGYPRGLKGEEIPMVARIFAIADVYDALTSNRPYRLAWTQEEALDFIHEQSGKHFDPKVVEAFMKEMVNAK